MKECLGHALRGRVSRNQYDSEALVELWGHALRGRVSRNIVENEGNATGIVTPYAGV